MDILREGLVDRATNLQSSFSRYALGYRLLHLGDNNWLELTLS